MKKGCFLSVIVFLFVIIIAVYYIISYHGEEILNIGKEKLVALAEEKIQADIGKLKENIYTDSLKVVVDKYFSDIQELNIQDEINKIEEISKNIEVIIIDSKLDSAEFNFIKNKLLKNEK